MNKAEVQQHKFLELSMIFTDLRIPLYLNVFLESLWIPAQIYILNIPIVYRGL
jgi:hypothetical protein